ncbi:hypothetical protein QUA07_04875 [Microcoleus sp. T3_A4]|uniref:hypothetical protein n=1 Tax=Microcoleus sp. T3_A4 TaxID=2818968 RepID=UPI002FCF55C9
MNKKMELLETIRDIAKPFALAKYVDDWQHRAMKLSTISDFYKIRIRENAFISEGKIQFDLDFLSLSPLKQALKEKFFCSYKTKKIGYAFEYDCLSGQQYDISYKMYGDLDASEKIVMSTCAHAICNLSCPLEVVLDLCNLLYEEALHLEAISTLLSIDQSKKPWIPNDKQGNWRLVSSTDTIFSYLFIEHCLYEGRGLIAAAKGVYELQKYGIDPTVYQVVKSIFEQETNHALIGYFWLKQLDNGNKDEELKTAIKKFFDTEPMEGIESFRGKRQRFPLFLVSNYLKNRDYWQIRKIVMENAKHCVLTGELALDDEQLARATTELIW